MYQQCLSSFSAVSSACWVSTKYQEAALMIACYSSSASVCYLLGQHSDLAYT